MKRMLGNKTRRSYTDIVEKWKSFFKSTKKINKKNSDKKLGLNQALKFLKFYET